MVSVKEAGLPPGRLRIPLASSNDVVHTVSAKLSPPMKRFFQLLAKEIGRDGEEHTIARQTLSINYCPFQSPSWKTLAHAEQSRAFCAELWDGLLLHIAPSAVLVLGLVAQTEFSRALLRARWTMAGPGKKPVQVFAT
jgi:hypothetical protein